MRWSNGATCLRREGDRSAIVAVDTHGESYSVPRMFPKEIEVRQVRTRIGDDNDLPSVAKVKKQIAQGMVQALDRFNAEADETLNAQTHAFEYRCNTLVQRQRTERQTLVQVKSGTSKRKPIRDRRRSELG